MGGFDAGALQFKIQAAGAAAFKRDLADSAQAIDSVEKSSRKAAAAGDQLGSSQDVVGKKAKTAKQGLDAQGKASEELERKTRRSSKATDEQGRASETAAEKTARLKREQAEAARSAAEQAQAAEKLAGVLTTVGVATAATVGLAIAKNTEFDKAMSQVRAATMASIEDRKRLSEAALEAGADTAYSAREAAEAEEELAKAGMTVSQIVGGSLNGSLALAAAGQLQVARSAEIMATALIQFKLPAGQAGHVADVLAASAGKAQGGVEDMALALSYVGPVASGLKLSLEETAGGIALLASQGILGEKAGTSLRGVLMSLTAPSNIASKAMQQYSIDIWDANGNMLSLAAISEQLKQRLGGLTEAERSAALGRIFGNEQITAARILYDGGADAIEKWTAAVDDSGYAADQAAMRQDNLAGDVEKLGGAFDTALIRTGSGANDVLREMVQTVTSLVDWYGELPDGVQQTALVLGVATAAATLFAGSAVFLRVKFAELSAELKNVNGSMRNTALVAGGVGIALTAVLAIVGQLAMAHAEAKARAQAYADALEQGEEAARKFVADQLAMEDSFLWMSRGSAIDNAKKLGLSVEEVTDAVTGSAAEYEKFKEKVQDAYDTRGQGVEFGIAAQQLREKVEQLRLAQTDSAKASKEAAEAESALADSTEDSTSIAQSAADTYLEQAGAVDELESQLRELISTMMEANGQNQDAISANAQWQQSLAGVKDEVQAQKDAYEKTNGTLRGFSLSLDESTASGSDNAAMLADLAAEAQKAAEAQYDVDQSTMSGEDAARKYASTLANQRDAFEKSAVAAGYNADEVRALADRVFALPSEKEIDILANTRSAQDRINQIISANNNRVITLNVRTNQSQVRFTGSEHVAVSKADGGHVKFYADGGNEKHDAQYAQPGTWRVWAEPETGGEWYLPDAPAKRQRSLAIASTMVKGWGYELTPKGVETFAAGGTTLSSAKGEVAAAERRLREAETRLNRTGKKSKKRAAAEDAVKDAKRDLQDARQDLAAAQADFRMDKIVFDRGTRRGENRDAGMNGNGYQLIDKLYGIAYDIGGKYGRKLDMQAYGMEKNYKRLDAASDRAQEKVKTLGDRLQDFKDQAASMAASVASTARSFFNIGDAAKTSTTQAATTRMVDGVALTTVQSTTKAANASGFAKSVTASASRIKRFAKKLKQLANEGWNGALLAEIAAEGVETGEAIADVLLSATKEEKKQIQQGLADIDKYSNLAGETVADANFAKLISAAEKDLAAAKTNADNIQKQLAAQTDRLIKTITGALATGMRKADGGLVTFHADGSVPEQHIAQIARAGDYRVWAEDETGGEGYIPLHPSKRQRSEAIMSEIARRFGGTYIPGGSRGYADGAVTGGTSLPSKSVHVEVTQINPVSRDPLKDAWEAAQLVAEAAGGDDV